MVFPLFRDVYEAGSTTALLQLRFLERGSTLTAFATGTIVFLRFWF